MDEGREPRIAGYTVRRPRTTPVISAVEVEERVTIKEEVQEQARVEASWITVPLQRPVAPLADAAGAASIDAAERIARERQGELMEKQVVAEAIKRKRAPPRVVERRRARELAAFKEEKFAVQREEVAALEAQGVAPERIAETVYTPLPVAEPVTVAPEPLVVGLDPGPDTMFRRLLLLGIIASIAKGLSKN